MQRCVHTPKHDLKCGGHTAEGCGMKWQQHWHQKADIKRAHTGLNTIGSSYIVYTIQTTNLKRKRP